MHVRFLVWAVRFRNRSCHSSPGADSKHSNKKVLMSCLWCSALPGIGPSVIANQCPEYKLTGRTAVNSLQGRPDIWPPVMRAHPHSGREQTWFDDLSSEFKLRPLPLISEWQMVNTIHEYKLMRPHNRGAQTLITPRGYCEWWLCFRISEGKNQSHYPDGKKKKHVSS